MLLSLRLLAVRCSTFPWSTTHHYGTMLFTALSVSLSAIGLATALPSSQPRSPYVVKERHLAPVGWENVGPAAKDEMVHLQIALKQGTEGEVERHLEEVSDPSHARYGQHLTAEDIHALVAPAEESVELVKAWLADHGITDHAFNPSRDWVSISVPIEKVESMLDTTYSRFRHRDGSELSRAEAWSLPAHLHEHIDVVQPTNSFFRPAPKANSMSGPVLGEETISMEWFETIGKNMYPTHKSSGADASVAALCNISFTTIDCLRTLYGTIDYEPQSTDKNAIAITNYLNETSKRSDVRKFLRNFRPEAVGAANTFPIEIVADANNDQGPYTAEQIDDSKNVEGNLDAELVLGISWPTPFNTINTGGSPPFKPDILTPTNTNEPYLTFLNYILAQSSIPQVISTSYGDDEQTIPESYARRVCSGFAQLGARGVSAIFSSGDFGVGADGTCYSNDGKDTYKFLPAFPAGCPWVTTVGGTEGFAPEVAVSRFASGGGFSDYFKAPKYQKKTVKQYVKSLGGLYDGLYNKKGRGYPDVAAQGNHDVIVWAGNITTVGGTSASSPTFAAIIALVNDALLAAGKPVLGFLNRESLSSAPSQFHNIC